MKTYCQVPGRGRFESTSLFEVNGEKTKKFTLYERGIYIVKAGYGIVRLTSGLGGSMPILICQSGEEAEVEISFHGKEKLGGGGALSTTEATIQRS